MSIQTTIRNATASPDGYFVEDCLSSLFDLENTYGVPNVVEAVVRLIGLCSCADDPAECAGCQVKQRVAARTVPTQPTAVTR